MEDEAEDPKVINYHLEQIFSQGKYILKYPQTSTIS